MLSGVIPADVSSVGAFAGVHPQDSLSVTTNAEMFHREIRLPLQTVVLDREDLLLEHAKREIGIYNAAKKYKRTWIARKAV